MTRLDMIVGGTLSEESHINELCFAAKFGVSRTPLREAFSRLGRKIYQLQTP